MAISHGRPEHQSAVAPAEGQGFSSSGARRIFLCRTDRQGRARPGMKRRGLPREVDVTPCLPPTEISVLRRRSFFFEEMTFPMYLGRPVTGRHSNQRGAIPRYAGRAKAAARGVATARGYPFFIHAAITKTEPCQLFRAFPRRDKSVLFAAISWILLRVGPEAMPMRNAPLQDLSGGRLRILPLCLVWLSLWR